MATYLGPEGDDRREGAFSWHLHSNLLGLGKSLLSYALGTKCRLPDPSLRITRFMTVQLFECIVGAAKNKVKARVNIGE